jgi:nucleoid-associated protein YgaU
MISSQIYRSPNYYTQIAQFNHLNKFRRLQPGISLVIPPLKAESTANG